MDDLKAFRQVDSLTPGHPEFHHTDGVEVTTGPLGQGFANAVGLAIAQAHMAAVYNKPDIRVITNHTYSTSKCQASLRTGLKGCASVYWGWLFDGGSGQ